MTLKSSTSRRGGIPTTSEAYAARVRETLGRGPKSFELVKLENPRTGRVYIVYQSLGGALSCSCAQFQHSETEPRHCLHLEIVQTAKRLAEAWTRDPGKLDQALRLRPPPGSRPPSRFYFDEEG